MNTSKFTFLVVCFFLSWFNISAQQSMIRGKMLDPTGNPLSIGHVHVGGYNDRFALNPLSTIKINNKGEFSFSVEKGKPISLRFTAPNSGFHVIDLPYVDFTSINITVTMEKRKITLQTPKPILLRLTDVQNGKEHIINTSTQNNFNLEFDLTELQPAIYKYQIDGICDLLVAGDGGDSLVYAPIQVSSSGGGIRGTDSYVSFINTTKKQKLLLDLRNILSTEEKKSATITSDSLVNFCIQLRTNEENTLRNDLTARSEYREKYGSTEGFSYNWMPYASSLEQLYEKSNDTRRKNYILSKLAFMYIGNKYNIDTKYALKALRDIKPSNPLWTNEQFLLSGVFAGLGGFRKSKDLLMPLLDSLLEYTPHKESIPRLLYMGANESYDLNKELFFKYYSQLITDYPQSSHATTAQKRMGEKLKITKGALLPEFEVQDIKTGNKITSANFINKVYIIDFWATWCGPCLKQMPFLYGAYEKFKSKGLEIITISLDEDIESVKNYHKRSGYFPWHNGFIGNDKAFAEKFEIFAIPKTILIDKLGKIITLSRIDLENKNLEKTIEQILGTN